MNGFHVIYFGAFIEFRADNGLVVDYCMYYLSVTLPSSFKRRVHGFCGDFDGDMMNDAVTSNGTDVHSNPEVGSIIGDSYVVGQANAKRSDIQYSALKHLSFCFVDIFN